MSCRISSRGWPAQQYVHGFLISVLQFWAARVATQYSLLSMCTGLHIVHKCTSVLEQVQHNYHTKE